MKSDVATSRPEKEPAPTLSPPTAVRDLLADPSQEGNRPGVSTPPKPRFRWQIPVFMAGVVAALLTWWWQPWRAGRQFSDWQTLIAQALKAEQDGDYATAHQLAEQVLSGSAPPRTQAVAALVLAGCLLAETDTHQADPSDWLEHKNLAELGETSELSAELLQRIGSVLDQAERLGLPRDWQPRWAYRKLWWQVLRNEAPPDWPQRLRQLLEKIPGDRAVGYERLVCYYLRLIARQPHRSAEEIQADWQAALEASQRLLVQPEVRDMQAARLRHARLLVQLQRYTEARETLARIPPQDSRYPHALHLIAKTWWEENRFDEAASVWKRLLQIVPDNWPQLPQVLLWLGACYAEGLQDATQAERLWQRLLQNYPEARAECQAAQLRWGLLRQLAGQHQEALRLLQQALQTSVVSNPYLPPEQLENWLQEAWRRWMDQGQYELARDLARAWQTAVGQKSTAQLALAQASFRWAEQFWQRQQNGDRLDADQQNAMIAAFREAGEIFEQSARSTELQSGESTGSVPNKVRWLHQAAVCFQHAQDYPRAIRLLEHGLAELDRGFSPKPPHPPNLDQVAVRQEMLIMLGECWHQLKLAQKAVEAFQKALALHGPHRIRGYYQMALALMDLGKLDEAEQFLREILAVPVSAHEPVEYRQALSALGHIHFRREQYETAAEYLDKAISRYDPQLPQSFSLRYWLAECYRLAGKQEDRKAVAADTETRRQFHRQQKRKYLSRAVEGFQTLAENLSAREKQKSLSEEQAILLRESRFALADCYFYLGAYDKAAAVYEALGREYDRQLPGLRAWFEARRAYLAAQRTEEALRAIEQARLVLQQLRDEDLIPTRMTRRQWVQYLDEARENALLPEMKP